MLKSGLSSPYFLKLLMNLDQTHTSIRKELIDVLDLYIGERTCVFFRNHCCS